MIWLVNAAFVAKLRTIDPWGGNRAADAARSTAARL
jgi:hypothetical protein